MTAPILLTEAELTLRRRDAETPLFFDAARAKWRADMRRMAEARFPTRRDAVGRFAKA